MPVKRGEKQLAENRKARHEYFIEDTYECGMALVGTEVKSIRLGKVNIKDSYVKIKNGEAFVVGMHISPYEKGNIFNRDPFRERKLLLHKREILKLLTLSQRRRGKTCIIKSPAISFPETAKPRLQKAKNFTISGMISPNAMQSAQWTGEMPMLIDGVFRRFRRLAVRRRTVYNPNPPSAHNQSCSMVLFVV